MREEGNPLNVEHRDGAALVVAEAVERGRLDRERKRERFNGRDDDKRVPPLCPLSASLPLYLPHCLQLFTATLSTPLCPSLSPVFVVFAA